MLLKKPTFKESEKLARYIDPEYRNPRNLPATGAYQRQENEDYLSVNSTEVETVRSIAQTYANIFNLGNRPVAVACPEIAAYNESAEKVGITLSFNTETGYWEFEEAGSTTFAYKHYKARTNASHCGVEYIRKFDDRADFRFAVRVAQSATYKMI